MTLWLLIRLRPDAVIVMAPPLFGAFAPIVFCWITGRPYALDCHTAAFTHPRFRRLQGLQATMERHAAINIVHNEHLQNIVVGRGAQAILVPDVPVEYQEGKEYDLPEHFNVTVVCSFNADEPIQEILAAARQVPEIQFYMTGNPKHLSERLKSARPKNVILTGFISDTAYGSLMRRSDVVMSLPTRDHTMLRGAWEAIYQGTPVIVSDWPVLKEAFDQGAIYVDNSPESIAAAIETAHDCQDRLRLEAEKARQSRIARWKQTRDALHAELFKQA
jgi:glycosyltransferase involved in cell wall biosynthesis